MRALQEYCLWMPKVHERKKPGHRVRLLNRKNNRIALTVGVLTVTAGTILVLIGIFSGIARTVIDDRIGPGLERIDPRRDNKNEAHEDPVTRPQRVCVSCHGDMKSSKTPWHRRHLTNTFTNFTCSTCHSKKMTTGRPRDLNGKMLVGRSVCRTCHGDRFNAYNEDHEKITWIRQHTFLRGDKTGGVDIYSVSQLADKYPECFICHGQRELSFCRKCHEQHPHDDQWINGEHGKQAVASNFRCLRCHEKTTWCTTQCHKGVTLPHNIPKWSSHYKDDENAPQWLRVHPEAAAASGVNQPDNWLISDPKIVCSMCHNKGLTSSNFCQSCHHQQFDAENTNPSAPWKDQHPTVVKNLGSSKCQKCHLLEFCAYCHTNGKKPARGMFLNRRRPPVPVESKNLDQIQ